MNELDQLRQRVHALEAAKEVSACLHDYMQLCDYLNEGFDLDPLMALFTEDAIWEGKGKRYAATFGRREGREAIRAMFDKYTQPPAHFALNVHFLTSERLKCTTSPLRKAPGCCCKPPPLPMAAPSSAVRC